MDVTQAVLVFSSGLALGANLFTQNPKLSRRLVLLAFLAVGVAVLRGL